MEINQYLEKFESDTLTKIIPALIKAQQDIGKIELNKKGNFGYYADISSCFSSIKPALLENGITFSQPIIEQDGKLYLYTILRHTSGEFLKSRIELIRTADNNMQKLGGQITYARRYAILGIVGVVGDEDDDGQNQADELANNRPQYQSAPSDRISEAQLKMFLARTQKSPETAMHIMDKYEVNNPSEFKKRDFNNILIEIDNLKK